MGAGAGAETRKTPSAVKGITAGGVSARAEGDRAGGAGGAGGASAGAARGAGGTG